MRKFFAHFSAIARLSEGLARLLVGTSALDAGVLIGVLEAT